MSVETRGGGEGERGGGEGGGGGGGGRKSFMSNFMYALEKLLGDNRITIFTTA